jgi:hypothetical protein
MFIFMLSSDKYFRLIKQANTITHYQCLDQLVSATLSLIVQWSFP